MKFEHSETLKTTFYTFLQLLYIFTIKTWSSPPPSVPCVSAFADAYLLAHRVIVDEVMQFFAKMGIRFFLPTEALEKLKEAPAKEAFVCEPRVGLPSCHASRCSPSHHRSFFPSHHRSFFRSPHESPAATPQQEGIPRKYCSFPVFSYLSQPILTYLNTKTAKGSWAA